MRNALPGTSAYARPAPAIIALLAHRFPRHGPAGTVPNTLLPAGGVTAMDRIAPGVVTLCTALTSAF